MKTPKLFTSNFDQKYMGVAVNYMLDFLRNGSPEQGNYLSVNALLYHLKSKQIGRYNPDRTLDLLVELIELNPLEAEVALDYYIKWEALPKDEKLKIKAKRSEFFVRSNMSQQPPTDKQLAYLKQNGVEVMPTTKLEATEMLSKIFGK